MKASGECQAKPYIRATDFQNNTKARNSFFLKSVKFGFMFFIQHGVKPSLDFRVQWFWTKAVGEGVQTAASLLLPQGTENTGLSQSRLWG